ncbi:MAG TPA: hypothetical protein VF260_06280 [Bacilli bacterium]
MNVLIMLPLVWVVVAIGSSLAGVCLFFRRLSLDCARFLIWNKAL